MGIKFASIYTGLFFLVLSGATGQTPHEIKKISILDPIDGQEKVSYYIKKSLQNAFFKAVSTSSNLEVYNRNDITIIQSENDFQRQGWGNIEEVSRMGKISGVSYVLYSEFLITSNNGYYTMAKILNIETSKVVKTADMIIKEDESPLQFHD